MQQTTHILSDRYELGPLLGQGGMARVHRGLDRHLRRPVAIKVLAPPFDRDKGFVERFRREARTAAGLSHPSIVAVFDSGSDDGTHFIVTELVEGETLADRLRRDGPMAPDDAVGVAVDVCRALEAAHARGLIHRDIKPGNVMLLPDGRVKVVDFGIARAAGSDTLTGTGVVLGSSAYLSPEQASGKGVDERADLYALGCVLYEMLTGEVPFRAETPVATMYRHVNEDPPPPSSVSNVRPELEDIVMRCLEKEPRRRFASAAELESALLAVLLTSSGDTQPLVPVGGSDDETRPIAPAPTRSAGRHRGRRIPVRGLAAASVIALLALAAFALASTNDGLRPRQAAREAGETASAATVPGSAPPSVAAGWTGLIDAIATGTASGGIEDKASEELAKRAAKVLEGYGAGDAEVLGKAIEDLEKELAKWVEEGEVSAATAAAIDTAMLELILALEADGALVEVASPTPEPTGAIDEGGEGDEGGHGDEGGGPPPHANDDKDED